MMAQGASPGETRPIAEPLNVEAPRNVGAPRIVSLSPHITELLFAAGAGARIVGVDDASDYPAGVAGIPRVGDMAAVDIEKVLRLQPTLVIFLSLIHI